MYASSGNKKISLNLVNVEPIKIMNRADKNWAQLQEIKYNFGKSDDDMIQ